MTRAAAWKLAYAVFLLTVAVFIAPFATPDMPWWAGLAIVGGLLAIVGAESIINDLRR